MDGVNTGDTVMVIIRNGTWLIGEVVEVDEWGLALREGLDGYDNCEKVGRRHAVAWPDVFEIKHPDDDGYINGLKVAWSKDFIEAMESA